MSNKSTNKSKLYRLLLASRSTVNESEAKGVYGCITTYDGDVVCYVPNKKMAELVLDSLNDGIVRHVLNGDNPFYGMFN